MDSVGDYSWHLKGYNEFFKLVEYSLLLGNDLVWHEDRGCVGGLSFLNIGYFNVNLIRHSVINSDWELLLYMEWLFLVFDDFNLLTNNVRDLLCNSEVDSFSDFEINWEFLLKWDFVHHCVWNSFRNDLWNFMSHGVWHLNFRDDWPFDFNFDRYLFFDSVWDLSFNSVCLKFFFFIFLFLESGHCNLIWNLHSFCNRDFFGDLVLLFHVVSNSVDVSVIRGVSRIVYVLGRMCLCPEVLEIMSWASRPGTRRMVKATIIVKAKVEINSIMA